MWLKITTDLPLPGASLYNEMGNKLLRNLHWYFNFFLFSCKLIKFETSCDENDTLNIHIKISFPIIVMT